MAEYALPLTLVTFDLNPVTGGKLRLYLCDSCGSPCMVVLNVWGLFVTAWGFYVAENSDTDKVSEEGEGPNLFFNMSIFLHTAPHTVSATTSLFKTCQVFFLGPTTLPMATLLLVTFQPV